MEPLKRIKIDFLIEANPKFSKLWFNCHKPRSTHLAACKDAQDVAQIWRKAFAEFGFCQAIGHGVPDRIRIRETETL